MIDPASAVVCFGLTCQKPAWSVDPIHEMEIAELVVAHRQVRTLAWMVEHESGFHAFIDLRLKLIDAGNRCHALRIELRIENSRICRVD